MQRSCRSCRKVYIPKTLSGGGLARDYKTCPFCRSEDTAVTAGSMSSIPKPRKGGPPSSEGYNYNRKKPPTH